MKKILAGCLIVLVIAMIGLGVAAFYAYRAMKPVIDNASNYMDKAREMSRLGDEIKIKTHYEPPENGELTAAQVERFLAVQTRVRSDLDGQWDRDRKEVRGASRPRLSANRKDWTLAEFTSVFSDIGSIYLAGRKSQVNALNIQRFSEEEYEWVRMRVYEAAGVRAGRRHRPVEDRRPGPRSAGKSGVEIPKMDLPEVPEANIELVKPHVAKIKEWVPMAVLGL